MKSADSAPDSDPASDANSATNHPANDTDSPTNHPATNHSANDSDSATNHSANNTDSTTNHSANNTTAPHSTATRISTLSLVLLATAVQLWAVLQAQPLQSANDRSRWATVWSLVERGTWTIDEIDQNPRWSTIDKVRHRLHDDQPYHFYSSKPPLLSTIVAGLYWLERQTLGYNLQDHTALVTRLLLIVVNIVPLLMALLVLRRSLMLLKASPAATIIVLLIAGFATMLNPFLTTLNNHTPAAMALVICLGALVHIGRDRPCRSLHYAMAGAMAALTCCFELPAALFGLATFFYCAAYDWRKTLKWYVPAALIPLAAFFVTNYLATGGIKPFYAYYGTDKYVYVHEGIPSYWSEPQGIDANTETPLVYLFHCVLGHHGLLSITPVLLLTLLGWALTFARNSSAKPALKQLNALGAALTLIVLSFYLTRTQNYNYGGNSAALRWMLWMIPFWLYGMLPAVEWLTRSRKGFIVVLLLLVPSVYSAAWSWQQPWRPGWIYQAMQKQGWIDYSTPIPDFDPERFAVIASSPNQAGVTGEWTGAGGADGWRFRIQTLPEIRIDHQPVFPWQVQLLNDDGRVLRKATVAVLPDGLNSGRDVGEFLRAVPSADQESAAAQPRSFSAQDLPTAEPWLVQFVRGLPGPRAYKSASPRYLRYRTVDGERTAIRCLRGASRVAFRSTEHGVCWQRCDVFYSDQLNFGVAQWIITVTRQDTGAVVKRDVWTSRNLPNHAPPP